ncbi:NAD(P)/FAD-dependent oxidoreductase [Streptomyces huasconensis]|uniref:NAD(P)/FAD-dependent oxidoreductase n=1 Tax=Streptomyces huasconensis TaxID=1854574 RepID=UPI0034107C48
METVTKSFDVLVVGNGVLGLSLGLTMARRGQQVAVLGEAHRPYAATTAAGAMLGCFGEVTAATLASESGRAKLELDFQATGKWDTWIADLAEDAGEEAADAVRTATGTIVLHNTIGVPEIDDAGMAAIRQAMDLYGAPYEQIAPETLDWLDPQPTARPLDALHIPGEHGVNSGALLAGLQQALVRRGGTMIAQSARKVLTTASGALRGVELADGTALMGDHVVLAAGVGSQKLLDTVPQAAAGIPRIVSGLGVSALLSTGHCAAPAPTSVVRTPNRAFACGLHLVPRGASTVYVGATNTMRPHPGDLPTVRGLQFLLDCVVRQLRRDLWFSGIAKVQVGNRPVSLDGFPLLGETQLEGLWTMTGTYRDGLHMSPLLAEKMTEWILDRKVPAELELFRPVRAPLSVMSREETIRYAVVHRLATGHEWDWSLPVEWPGVMEELFELSYRQHADDIATDFTPPPDLLAFVPAFPELGTMLKEYYAAVRGSFG